MMSTCDYCHQREAVLYCKHDAARLCMGCDHKIHSGGCHIMVRATKEQLNS